MAGGGRISNVVGQGYLGAQVAELLIFNSLLNENSRQSLESYLAQKWGLSIPLVYRKFADHSGGHRDLVFMGDDQTENQKFGNSLGFDGKDDFAHIPLVNPSNGNLSPNEVTRFDLLHAWWPLDGNGPTNPVMKEMETLKMEQVFPTDVGTALIFPLAEPSLLPKA